MDGPGYVSKKYGPVTYLDASAILNGDRLSVFLVNREPGGADGGPRGRRRPSAVVALESAEIVAGPTRTRRTPTRTRTTSSSAPFDDATLRERRGDAEAAAALGRRRDVRG